MAGHSSAGRDYRYPQDADPRTSSQQESDPLAELARLIGQTDPFSNIERPDPRAAQPHEAQAPAYHDDAYAPQDQQQDQSYDQYEAEPEAAPSPPAWLQSSQQAFAQQGWRPEHEPQETAVYEPHPEDRAYVEQQRAQAHSAYPQDDVRYDDALYGREPNAAPFAAHQNTPRDSGPPYAYPGHEQGVYDDYEADQDQGSRRRGGLFTVAAVLTLAVVGTAGALMYRSYTAGPQGEPPVIKADASPSKVVPPAPSKDPSGKVITDRIGQSGERIVPREEQPVNVAAAATPSGPRVVFPPLTQQVNGQLPAKSTSSQPAAQANASMSGGIMEEPKRIRTLSIKADQAESPAGVAASAPPPVQVAPAVPVPPRTAPIPTQAQPQAQTQRAPASGPSPMQLAPQSNTRTAAVAPQAPVASAPAQGGGGYLVQVSSQRSEGDALASYRALQAKYSGVLGSRQPVIRRADLPAGTYYRAMVGPFASSEDATQMCASLKAAGGVCLVQRN
jgi:hypothetical protein